MGQFSTCRSFFDDIGRFSMEKGRFSTSNFDRGSLFDGGHFSPLHRHFILSVIIFLSFGITENISFDVELNTA